VGVFDLCHMGRLRLQGAGVLDWLERVTPAKLNALALGQARYGVVLTEAGGIVDDMIVTHTDNDCYDLCVNAVNRQSVIEHLLTYQEGRDAALLDRTLDLAQIAVQGPGTKAAVDNLFGTSIPSFMATAKGSWNGREITVSRTGYSGELGVELFFPAQFATEIWQDLLHDGATPCGLGARDTLRLEMGYPLYGHELSLNTNPVDAGLSWTIQWDRQGWLGCSATNARRQSQKRNLRGLVLDAPGIPRQGCVVLQGGRAVGQVTSGNMGLTVGHGIALAYLPVDCPDVDLAIDVRGRLLPAHMVTPPFYQNGTLKA
jgi:aminomethyltransferase